MQYQDSAHPQDRARAHRANDLCNRSERAVHLHLLHAEREVIAHRLHEALGLVFLAHESLDHVDAGELLLQYAQHRVPSLAQLNTYRPDVADEELVVQHIERYDRHRHQGKLPLVVEKDEHQGQDAEQIRQERDESAGDHILDRIDVAGKARHDLTGLAGVVVGEREAIQVPVGLETKIEHDALPEPCHQVVQGEGDHAADSVQREYAPEDPVERPDIVVRQRPIDREADYTRHHDRRQRCPQQEQHRQRHARPIGLKIS